MVHAVQKGDIKAPSKEVSEAASSISPSDAKDFASTKQKGLPEKKAFLGFGSSSPSPPSPELIALVKQMRSFSPEQTTKFYVDWMQNHPDDEGPWGPHMQYLNDLRKRGIMKGFGSQDIYGAVESLAPKAACNKTMKKLRPKNKKQATDLMAAYVRILASKAAKNQKSASDSPLQRLAPAIQRHGDFFKALNEVYANKSAVYRVKIAKGLVRGLEAKLANMALQTAPQMGPQTMEIPSPNGARASALMNRLTGGVQQMQQAPQPQAAPEGIQ